MKRPNSRRVLVVLASVVAVLVICRVALGLRGGSRLDDLAREMEPEWSAARARLAELRHPWDPPATAPCGEAYLDAVVDLREDGRVVNEAAAASPRMKVRPEARAIVEAQRPVIDVFLRATGCGAYAVKADEAWASYDHVLRILGTSRLTVLDARMRAEAGDAKGAVDRLIAVAKAGTDLAQGSFVDLAVGGAMVSSALETLASLIGRGALSEEDRGRVEKALAALGPRMPSLARGIEKERLHLRWAVLKLRSGADGADLRSLGGDSASSLIARLLPLEAFFADGASRELAFLREAEARAGRERDGEKLRMELEALAPDASRSSWFAIGMPAGILATQSRDLCVPAAWKELVSAALAKDVAVEGILRAPVPDPCGAVDLRSAATIDGRVVLSSVGKDGKASRDDPEVEIGAPAAKGGDAAALDERASLSFVAGGKAVREITLGEMLRDLPVETFTAHDPYYNREKTFRAVPLADLVRKGLAGGPEPLPAQQYVLRARDGYTVPMRGSRVFEAGAYVAFADVEVPGWEPIGPQRASPGPFYLVWRGKEQQSLEVYPRPWQLASIEIARFEDLFPHTAPGGAAEGSPAARGFAIFREHCVHCHTINREGGRVGPELNVPRSIVEYRPADQIKAYVRDPLSFRYGNMPAHPFLKDGDLDDLLAYLGAMKDKKHDPAGGGTAQK